jgi:hypothetical protein
MIGVYIQYQAFIEKLEESLEIMEEMLFSKNTSDTIETIKTIKILFMYGVKRSHASIRNILVLTFSNEK